MLYAISVYGIYRIYKNVIITSLHKEYLTILSKSNYHQLTYSLTDIRWKFHKICPKTVRSIWKTYVSLFSEHCVDVDMPDVGTSAASSTAVKSSRRQSIIDGVRRFRHALLPPKDTSRSSPSQPSPSLHRRTPDSELDSAASRPQDKRPSTTSDRLLPRMILVSSRQ